MLGGRRRTLVFVLLSVGAGTLLWLSAAYFRRKRRQRIANKDDSNSATDSSSQGSIAQGKSRSRGLSRTSSRDVDNSSIDAIERLRASNSFIRPVTRVMSSTSVVAEDGKLSEDSTVDVHDFANDEKLVDDLIRKGINEFESAIATWHLAAEHLLEQQSSSQIIDGEIQIHEKTQQEETITTLISSSQNLRMGIVLRGLVPSNFAVTPRSIMGWMDEEVYEASYAELEEKSRDGDSDADSFVSASESAALEYDDLIDEKFISGSTQLKMFRQTLLNAAGEYSHLEFYVSGLEQYARCDVECRKMRTVEVGCESDMEFLAKVACVRQASELTFTSQESCLWFSEAGKSMLSSIITMSGKNPIDFQAAFDELLGYCATPENWNQVQAELLSRRVKTVSFYDVVMDYVLLDAFDDLATPPYSVATAIQNRWLSASIKETALTTAIWGVLKAKASYLEDQYGFMAHFYVVSQYIIPVLAWGFLGPNEELKELCEFFKDQIIGYIRDVFSFQTADYTSITSLSNSIISLAKQRSDVLVKRLEQALLEKSTA